MLELVEIDKGSWFLETLQKMIFKILVSGKVKIWEKLYCGEVCLENIENLIIILII